MFSFWCALTSIEIILHISMYICIMLLHIICWTLNKRICSHLAHLFVVIRKLLPKPYIVSTLYLHIWMFFFYVQLRDSRQLFDVCFSYICATAPTVHKYRIEHFQRWCIDILDLECCVFFNFQLTTRYVHWRRCVCGAEYSRWVFLLKFIDCFLPILQEWSLLKILNQSKNKMS